MSLIPGGNVAIRGIGMSSVGRPLPSSPLTLAVSACRSAVADAHLDWSDIDGLAAFPGGLSRAASNGVGPPELQNALRLELDWYAATGECASPLGAVFSGVGAIAAGLANHVLCFQVMSDASTRKRGLSAAFADAPVDGLLRWLLPFGSPAAPVHLALVASRYAHLYGLERQTLASVAINNRANAADNPWAVFQAPLTIDEYLAAPMIASPFCRFDCDVPVDGAVAFVLSRETAECDMGRAVRIASIGSANRGRATWDQVKNVWQMSDFDAAAMMWRRTDIRPTDVACAQLYDGMTFTVLSWLEALGFCGPGEAADFIEGGAGIARNGPLPINTDGGQLSAGKLQGFGHLYEGCLQVRGEAGVRQIPHAMGSPMVVSMGTGPMAGCVLLTGS
jgi:acetyl-CoA acetyltransferase